ncbi:hypothetical protein DFH09DRAFT_1441045 [Mycena vulgaris]|nr:hypothetical protein DFH09DRAFT_1441045 [Mycena vulgaris]
MTANFHSSSASSSSRYVSLRGQLLWRGTRALGLLAGGLAGEHSDEKPTISRISSNYVTPSITPECQAGLEVPNAVDDDEDDSPPAGAVSQTTLNVLRDGVDIRLPFFRDLLADKPIEGADAIRSLADWSEDVVGGVQGHRKAAVKKIWDGEVEKLVF